MRWLSGAVVMWAMGVGRWAPGQTRPAGCPTVLVGEVGEGHRFAKPFGGGLEFVLAPVTSGWAIRVEPVGGPGDADYAEVATPPFRSVNPLLLTTDFGFRAQDVVGWNPRSFRFASTEARFREARRAEQAVVRSNHPSSAETSAVAAVVAESQEARLTILDARLVPGSGDQSPAAGLLATHFLSTAHTIVSAGGAGALGRVEWMRFRVTLGGAPARWDTPACGGQSQAGQGGNNLAR